MARLSIDDYARYAHQAGFTGRDLTISIAVGFAESRGDPNKRGPFGERGPWQINTRPNAHPEFASWNLEDPATNAKAAYQIWQQRGWKEWTTYKVGLYLIYMPRAEVAAQKIEPVSNVGGAVASTVGHVPDTSTVTSQLGNASDALGAIGGAVRFLSVGENWGRLGLIVLGGVLVISALSIIAKPVIQPVAKSAAKLAA